WFLASTDFGLASQWLDMTSYDHDENFGLYVAVLKKSDPSPLLPESDEGKGVGTGTPTPANSARDNRTGAADTDESEETPQTETPTPRRPRTPVNVQIDFPGLQQRIV